MGMLYAPAKPPEVPLAVCGMCCTVEECISADPAVVQLNQTRSQVSRVQLPGVLSSGGWDCWQGWVIGVISPSLATLPERLFGWGAGGDCQVSLHILVDLCTTGRPVRVLP